jgi:hypothetical protein
LSDELGDDELEILRDSGLMERCPDAFRAWTDRKSNTDLTRQARLQDLEVEAKERFVLQDIPRLQNIILHILVKNAVKHFP